MHLLFILCLFLASASKPATNDICLVTGPVTDSLISNLPNDSTTYGIRGKLYVNKIFLKRSDYPRTDADSALKYFELAQQNDSSNTLVAYQLIAQALYAREDGFWDKFWGITSSRITQIFNSADSLARVHPNDYPVLFLVANLLAEADSRLKNHEMYWLRAQELFHALDLYAQATKLVDLPKALEFFNEEIVGTILLNEGKLTLKLAGADDNALPEARELWSKVVELFPQTSAADNARIQLEKYKM
jgi:hypothetical protein